MRRMALRKPPPIEHAQRVIDAVQALADAHTARDQAIVDALNAGGSVRLVAQAAGMSPSQIQKIGKAGGWPNAKLRKQWNAEDAERHKWDHLIELGRQMREGRSPDET
jgi:AraC-like DNA-binding protein